MKKVSKTIKAPMVRCPVCFEKAYAYQLKCICPDKECLSEFTVPVSKIKGMDGVIDVDPKDIKLTNVENISSIISADSGLLETNNADEVLWCLSGPILDSAKELQKKQGYKTIKETLIVLLYTILQLNSTIEKHKGDYFGFINSKGEKSKNLKNGALFIDASRKIANSIESKDTAAVFVEEMERRFKADDMMKFYAGLERKEK